MLQGSGVLPWSGLPWGQRTESPEAVCEPDTRNTPCKASRPASTCANAPALLSKPSPEPLLTRTVLGDCPPQTLTSTSSHAWGWVHTAQPWTSHRLTICSVLGGGGKEGSKSSGSSLEVSLKRTHPVNGNSSAPNPKMSVCRRAPHTLMAVAFHLTRFSGWKI